MCEVDILRLSMKVLRGTNVCLCLHIPVLVFTYGDSMIGIMTIVLLVWLFNRVDLIKPVSNVHPWLYVRLSTKSFFDFNETWHVGRGRWVMHDGMQYDLLHGQGHEPSILEIRPFSKAISSSIYNGSWQLTTNSQTRAQYLNLIGLDFLYFS